MSDEVEVLKGRFQGFLDCRDLKAFIAIKDGDRILFQQCSTNPLSENEALRTRIAELEAREKQLREAVATCVDAMRDYIVPDGISPGDAMSVIIGALDNPEINPIIFEMDRQALSQGEG